MNVNSTNWMCDTKPIKHVHVADTSGTYRASHLAYGQLVTVLLSVTGMESANMFFVLIVPC